MQKERREGSSIVFVKKKKLLL